MPGRFGEIRYDDEGLPRDLALVAADLEEYGAASFRYAAFGSGHSLAAFDARLLGQRGELSHLLATGDLGIDPGQDSHTLFVREARNHLRAAWLARGSYHAPSYLREKYDVPAPDAHALAVAIALIEEARRRPDIYEILRGEGDGFPSEQTRDNIRRWTAELVKISGGAMSREVPTFMGGDPSPI